MLNEKISVIFGTRPEAIKLCPVVLALKEDSAFDCKVCVTGQHREMLQQVLDVFGVVPDRDLSLMQPNQTLGGLTSRAIAAIDQYLTEEKPYIFNYVLDEWADGDNEARALECVKKSLDTEAVKNDRVPVEGSLSLFAKVFGIQAKTSVGKWLSLIANSEFVVTNSFHGTVFAILFHKPFISLLIPGRMSGMNERILSLLKLLGLEDRTIDPKQAEKIKNIMNVDVDWSVVDSVLTQQRGKAIQFVDSKLNIDVR